MPVKLRGSQPGEKSRSNFTSIKTRLALKNSNFPIQTQHLHHKNNYSNCHSHRQIVQHLSDTRNHNVSTILSAEDNCKTFGLLVVNCNTSLSTSVQNTGSSIGIGRLWTTPPFFLKKHPPPVPPPRDYENIMIPEKL